MEKKQTKNILFWKLFERDIIYLFTKMILNLPHTHIKEERRATSMVNPIENNIIRVSGLGFGSVRLLV
jgi:hypothetical protein